MIAEMSRETLRKSEIPARGARSPQSLTGIRSSLGLGSAVEYSVVIYVTVIEKSR